MVIPLSIEDFLDKKRDFSPLLAHLTRSAETFSAKEVLGQILNERVLRAFNHYCLFSPSLRESKDPSLQEKFKVVCFTETPIDQVQVLLDEVRGRNMKPDPYGLVFKKEFIGGHGGNPVFYVGKEIAKPLWSLYWNSPSDDVCRLLALVTLRDENIDFHWEREWRIVGSLSFNLHSIYCGLCPQDDIAYFESQFSPVKFISPYWGINRILDKLVGR
jgi:hypothetical protein